jgi:cystathionine gamma-lyase
LHEVPATTTHKGMPVRAREESGVFGNLVRLSIGLEDVEYLKEDLVRAWNVALLRQDNSF